jgi:hypothetical protein
MERRFGELLADEHPLLPVVTEFAIKVREDFGPLGRVVGLLFPRHVGTPERYRHMPRPSRTFPSGCATSRLKHQSC